MKPLNISAKFALFSELWRPKVIAELNGQEVKLVKFQGEFPWHLHQHEDEFFLVWSGRFRIEFRDHIVELGPGDAFVVPRGVEHRTVAGEEAHVILFEPAAVRNTGNVQDETYTAPNAVRIWSCRPDCDRPYLIDNNSLTSRIGGEHKTKQFVLCFPFFRPPSTRLSNFHLAL